MKIDTEKCLVEALSKELDKLPAATWTTIEQLADSSPRLQRRADGRYAIAGENASASLADLEDVEWKVLQHVEDAGMFVDYDYECGFSVRERVPSGAFDFSNVSSLTLLAAPALSPFGATEIKFDGTTLSLTMGFSGDADSVKGITAMGKAEHDELRALIADSDIPSWKREYHNYHVLDGWGWNLLIRFNDERVFASGGSNEWPESFGKLWDGLHAILGVEAKWERPI